MKRGKFITVEGTDGSGKSTQIELMKQYLTGNGLDVVLTREPGGTEISEKIRAIILDNKNAEMSNITEMLLYAAARAQLMHEVISPAIEEGKIVIADRFIDSSYVYQGYGRGMGLEIVDAVNNVAINGIFPDMTVFFDISPEIALKRRMSKTGADRIEEEDMEFHMKVYNGYKELAQKNPQRIKTVDSNRCIEEIAKDVIKLIDEII